MFTQKIIAFQQIAITTTTQYSTYYTVNIGKAIKVVSIFYLYK